MNLANVTIQDCIDMYHMKDMATIINDGNVSYFIKEDKKNGSTK